MHAKESREAKVHKHFFIWMYCLLQLLNFYSIQNVFYKNGHGFSMDINILKVKYVLNSFFRENFSSLSVLSY